MDFFVIMLGIQVVIDNSMLGAFTKSSPAIYGTDDWPGNLIQTL